ncbi:DEAD-box helicase 27 [Ictidomys tridecemlineatus]|uniref:Probable ATP-dependent RNA helicase DDX27 n=1 Tax=Ictidomys tridecemlineatus TaxID=43179 RepID=I3M2Q1_ICTTR|nr:probable ATP-dependent RNA helicase DDX27 [Ictidomys tridecemlineatus]KAG3263460.1 DEAD-box helicase 27 [Ictidomys tridecemlineatus]
MLAELGLIGTIGEDDEVPMEPESDSGDEEEEGPIVLGRKQKALQKNRSADFNPDFVFTEKEGMYDGSWALADVMSQLKKKRAATTLDEKIEKVRKKRKTEDKEAKAGKLEEKEGEEPGDPEQGDLAGTEEEAGSAEEESESEYSAAEEDILTKADTLKVKERRRKKKGQEAGGFFEDASQYDENLSFQDMNLSRPLLKAITAMGFRQPTPIQKACIPVGLLGKDICACAATGTGKTAAFALPVLERLIYKPRQGPVTRVLVLVPTRELGIQVHSVTKQLAQFCNITTCLAVGGLDVKSQEAALRAAPDILIATPGRLIDHLHNCPSFHLSSIEVLILDEADRMLDEYFEEQMKEIIRMCSHHRQTMLFSATMTDEVKDLASVSLKNPVRVFVNSNTDVAPFLRQEFIRIRPNREGDREAIVAALLTRTFTDHVMLFTQTKKQAHRMHILLGLLGLQVGELHGNLSQTQRLEALRRFKDEQIDILVATDVAARGLDIEGVKTVINFTMPNTIKHYVHRVGRTARAGRAGRSVSLVGEEERKMLKEIVKAAKAPVKARILPQDVILKFRDKIEKMEKDVYAVLQLEAEEREMQQSEAQINTAKRLLEKGKEAVDKEPERSWFQTKEERKKEKIAKALQEFDLALRGKKRRKKFMKDAKRKGEMTAEERSQFEILKAQMFAERLAKRNRRAKRARAMPEEEPARGPAKKQKPKKKSVFDEELTNTSKKALKQYRAGPSFEEKKQLGLPHQRRGGNFKSKSRYKRKK